MSTVTRLDFLDYTIAGVLVLLSTLIGIYHAFKARKETNVSTFLISASDVGIFPVIFSAVATQVSAIGILGLSAEVYQHGLVFAEVALAALIIIPIGNYLYLPVFHGLKIKSIFQYLELRFNRTVRSGAALIDIICRIFVTSISLYAPAVALNQVSGLHLWTAVLIIGCLCICYTSLGGIKAIIWTDVVQLFVMVAVLTIIIIKGYLQLGGWHEIWRINKEGGRVNFIPEKESYYTPWTTLIGCTFNFTSLLMINQMFVQRYLSKGTLKSAQISYSGCCIGFSICTIYNCISGVLLYANYHDCDPLLNGQVASRDQIMALFSMETLSFVHGLKGVFVAAMLCATLSTLSSLLNSMVVVTIEDFIRPLNAKLSEKSIMRLSKILVLAYGILSIVLVAVAQRVPGIVQAIFSFPGTLVGPLLGVFTIGMLLPWMNTWGAITGYVAAVGLNAWPTIGIMLTNPKKNSLALSVAGCGNSSFEDLWGNSSTSGLNDIVLAINTTSPPEETFLLYQLSPLWYFVWSCLVVLIIGLTVSLLSGAENPEEIDPKLLFPFVRKIIINLPRFMRKWLGFSNDTKQHLQKWDFKQQEKELEMMLSTENNNKDKLMTRL